MKFDQIEDVPAILKNNLVLFDGRVVKVREVSVGGRLVSFNQVGSSRVEVYGIDDDRWKFCPPKLGMVETDVGCYYVSRDTRRQYHISLCPRNALIQPIGGIGASHEVSHLAHPSFQDMHDGRYRTFKEACKEIYGSLGTKFSSSFSRHYAVDYEGSLWFKTKRIGLADMAEGKVVRIDGKYAKYLKEVLE